MKIKTQKEHKMSLGKVKFEDGREVELVEVLDDVIVIEKAGKDGEVKRYRLKKTSEMYESVADQVDALVKGGKKKAPKPAEVELDEEDDDDEEEVATKPAKKTGSVKGGGKAKDDADDDEEEAPKETKKGKKVSKPVEPKDDEVEDDEEDEAPAPKAKKAVKTEKTSKAPAPKVENLYDWDAVDGYQALTVNIETLTNANEAAKYFFTCENERELQAVIFMLNVDRVQTTTKNANLSIFDIKAVADSTKKRAKETDYIALLDILSRLTDSDNSALIPEIVAATAEADEKSIFIAFDTASTKKVWGFLEKNLKTLVEISDSIAKKLLK